MRIRGKRILLARTLATLLLASFVCSTNWGASDSSWVKSVYRKGDFQLVHGGRAADILVAPEDFKVVQIAAAALTEDVERVTGKKSTLRSGATGLSAHAVIVGTLGKSSVIEALVQTRKLDVTSLRGRWESFLIATVPNPLPNVAMGLVIVGSDRRGTAFGVFELSQTIGVSPWYWWADVTPKHQVNLIVKAGARREGPPSVQYRGIFLNDEDLGLQPWAAKTFDPQLGDIGPKTYARVFELLLRLKANTLWPAMHGCTKAFNLYPDNRVGADEYAIVMGSSHAEPMLRNNVTEWTDNHENYDYTKNAAGVRRYWEERAAQNGRYENIFTIGMRGIHDSPIQGPKTSPERIKVLEEIFADQRAILSKNVNSDVAKVPQIFCPYKEVLTDYRNGLKVPDDVTIVWPDDNFGYIRYLPTAEEQKRSGGFGIYYHVSYLGGPLSYLWLDTTPPSLIWEEMSKAYDHGVRKFWMLNVGDIKPAEISIELFMQMGWDISRWRRENLNEFLEQWATSKFRKQYASEIAAVMDEYYRLGFARKPEHLQWNFPNQPPQPSDLTAIDYGDETQARLDAYDALLARVNRLSAQIPAAQRDAFFELVAYPVRGAALANRRYFATEKSAIYAEQGRASAVVWEQRAKDADAEMNAETIYYNQKIARGKWRSMMTIEPPKGQWENMRMLAPVAPPSLSQMKIPEGAGLGVAIEGRREPLHEGENAALPPFNVFTRDVRFIDIFNTGRSAAPWTAKARRDWIKLSRPSGDLRDDSRILVSIDWSRAPKGDSVSGAVEVNGAGAARVVQVPIFNPALPRPGAVSGFVESNGIVVIEAAHFTNRIDRGGVGWLDRGGAGWRVIPGLGRTGDSVGIFPTTASSVDPTQIASAAPVIEYRLHLFTSGRVNVACYLVPTHSIQAGCGLRYAIGFDDQPPQIVTVDEGLTVPSRAWSLRVLNATTTGQTTLEVAAAGPHVLKIYMVDPGVVLDKIVLDVGGLRPSYLGPPETKVM